MTQIKLDNITLRAQQAVLSNDLKNIETSIKEHLTQIDNHRRTVQEHEAVVLKLQGAYEFASQVNIRLVNDIKSTEDASAVSNLVSPDPEVSPR